MYIRYIAAGRRVYVGLGNCYQTHLPCILQSTLPVSCNLALPASTCGTHHQRALLSASTWLWLCLLTFTCVYLWYIPPDPPVTYLYLALPVMLIFHWASASIDIWCCLLVTLATFERHCTCNGLMPNTNYETQTQTQTHTTRDPCSLHLPMAHITKASFHLLLSASTSDTHYQSLLSSVSICLYPWHTPPETPVTCLNLPRPVWYSFSLDGSSVLITF